MELNVELDQSSNWQSVTDLYDVVFADDTNSSNTNTTSDNMSDTATVLSQFDGSTSYFTLKSPHYTQNFNHEENISSFLNEQIEEIEGRDSFDNATLGNLLSGNSKTLNSNWDGIPVSQINENAHIEIISPPFDIPQGKSINDECHTKQQENLQGQNPKDSQYESKRTEALSLDEVVKTCLAGVQHLTDMEFNISNTKSDGKEFIKIEVKIPRDSLLKRDASTIQHNIDSMAKEPKIYTAKQMSSIRKLEGLPLKHRKGNLSQHSSYDSTENGKQEQILYRTNESTKRIDLQVEQKSSKSLKRTEDILANRSVNQTQIEPQQSQKRKLLTTESEASEPCKVCGEMASKFMHYGGRSCQSCRAFFRRTVEKHVKKPWIQIGCSCNERCGDKKKILCSSDDVKRKKCKWCRFEKCKKLAGMETKWVMCKRPRRKISTD